MLIDVKFLAKVVLITVAVALFMWWLGSIFGPGVNVHAEDYTIYVDEPVLIEAIQNFKKENPQYNLPENITMPQGNVVHLADGRDDSTDRYYLFRFYYPKENQIVSTYVQQIFKGKTTFAFLGVNYGLTLGNGKSINEDFDREENRLQLQLFEERILNKVKERLP